MIDMNDTRMIHGGFCFFRRDFISRNCNVNTDEVIIRN